MKQWKIPVTWEVFSTITVEADTIEDAMEIARDDAGDFLFLQKAFTSSEAGD